MPDSAAAIATIEECIRTLDAIHGLFLDGTYGMGTLAKQTYDRQVVLLNDVLAGAPPPSPDALNPTIAYFSGPPEARTVIHHAPANDYIARNAPEGVNWRLLAQYCLVAFYQFWDETFRPRVAEYLGRDKNDIRIDSFGELRHFRRAIIHNRARALAEMASNRHLPAFPEGASLDLSAAQVHAIFDTLKRDLLAYSTGLTGAA